MENLRLAPGSLFANRFEIQRTAGIGGMGTVYRAIDRYSGDTVALKLLHSGLRSSEETERFVREAQLLSELRHPGIVSYVTHGQTPDGQRFLAMEWLAGHDLGERLARGALPVRDCVLLLEQVGDALSVAHQRGIIHRDLKPSNLFLIDGDVGRVKILDFGIARRVSPSKGLTKTGMVVGTPEYMAPEQARGSRDVTPAADLFSLGCILYECLTGHPPFVADHIAAVLVRILLEEPVPLDELRPGLPSAIVALVARLLAKHPERRLADAAALRAELLSLGELPEPALAATMAQSEPKVERFAEQEQSLFSVVLAAPSEESIEFGRTQPGRDVQLAAADRQALLHSLAALGGSPDFLANGTLVVIVPPLASAQDQVTLAARSALRIKEHWPGAVVSMATGRGAIHGRTAVGEVIELAARSLKSESSPSARTSTSGVWIDPLSAKLLEGRFAQTPQPGGALLLYEELDADVSRPLLGKPTPCVGRETELATLSAHLDGCIDESVSRAVLITALPGVGKSRLRHEFLRRVEQRNDPVLILLGRGDMISAGAPYGILATALRRLWGFTGGEPPEVQRKRLRERIGKHVDPAEQGRVVCFIGELCNLPFPEAGNPLLQAARLDPRIMGDQIALAFLDFLRAECVAQPLLLVLEDLHWGDALTIRLIETALRELSAQPFMVLALARPEIGQQFANLWAQHVQKISLRPLGKKACERLVHQVLGKQLAAETVLRIIDRSAGNALYLEEMIRAVADGKQQEMPETVLAMLQARIGHLEPDARRLLRLGSVFGESFLLGGVRALQDKSRVALDAHSILTALVQNEVLEQRRDSRFPTELGYRFRHALMREAAYSLLTAEDRSTAHRLAGRFLAELGEDDPRVLAEHFELGGDAQAALAHYVHAAQLAYQRNHSEQVLVLVERGLACGATHETRGELLALRGHSQWSQAQMGAAVTSAEEALRLLRAGSRRWWAVISIFIACTAMTKRIDLMLQGAQLASTVEPDEDAIVEFSRTMYGLSALLSLSGARDMAITQLMRLKRYVEPLPQTGCQAWAYLDAACGFVTWALGDDPWTQMVSCQKACTALDEIGERFVVSSVEILFAHALTELGEQEQAKQRLRRAHLASQQSDVRTNVYLAAFELSLALSCSETRQDQEEAYKLVLDARATLDGKEDVLVGLGALALASSLARRGELGEAEHAARQSAETFAPMPVYRLRALVFLTKLLLAQGQIERARAVAEEQQQLLGFVAPVGSIEVPARLAVAEALHAAGDLDAARSALGDALKQLRTRAGKIPDQTARRRYLAAVSEHAQVVKLAREWLGDYSADLS